MGLDFNTELVEAIGKVKGANYFSVHSPGAAGMDIFPHLVVELLCLPLLHPAVHMLTACLVA